MKKAIFYLFGLPMCVFFIRLFSFPFLTDETSTYWFYIGLVIWMVLLARYFLRGFK